MIKAVLFDLDGTLINSIDDLADSANHTLAAAGLPTHATESYKYFVGNGMRKLIIRALPENMRDDATVDKTLAAFMEYYSAHSLVKTRPYDDIKPLLEGLLALGIKTAVVTNKAHPAAVAIVRALFDDELAVFGQREGIPTKPDPTLTLLAAETLSVRPEECLFVGDSGMDMAVGVNAKMLPVGVTWGFRKADELIENGAARLIDKPLELLEVIKQING